MAQQSRAEYVRENTKKNYRIDKALGIRYRSQEAFVGETFLQFKKRMQQSKFVFVICAWSFGIFQILRLGM